MPGPSAAFTLLICGVLAIYCELIWPGTVFPGVLGSAAAIAGGYSLWRSDPSAAGLTLIGAAIVLFLCEARVDRYFICGITGTGCLAAGSLVLFNGPRRIDPALAIVLSFVFGLASIFLAHSSKRARRNKRSDL